MVPPPTPGVAWNAFDGRSASLSNLILSLWAQRQCLMRYLVVHRYLIGTLECSSVATDFLRTPGFMQWLSLSGGIATERAFLYSVSSHRLPDVLGDTPKCSFVEQIRSTLSSTNTIPDSRRGTRSAGPPSYLSITIWRVLSIHVRGPSAQYPNRNPKTAQKRFRPDVRIDSYVLKRPFPLWVHNQPPLLTIEISVG
ncbi:hypothetical protein F5141DRAFT_449839 [Pisolithus sp. B1]|nr:hypothetical protein F5141DRAFT_449839 [Pisolithus sp. B1]